MELQIKKSGVSEPKPVAWVVGRLPGGRRLVWQNKFDTYELYSDGSCGKTAHHPEDYPRAIYDYIYPGDTVEIKFQ